MSQRRISYLVVEGPHDVEFVGRFLTKFGSFKRVRRFNELETGLDRLVPREFPHQGELLARVPVPVFFQNENHAVCVHSAEGIDNLATIATDSLAILGSKVKSVGVILDRDDDGSVAERYQKLTFSFQDKLAALTFPNHPGQIQSGDVLTGIYILPDNTTLGTLEDILLDVGELAYPDLIQQASRYVDAVEVNKFRSKDRKDFQKPAGIKKAKVAAAGAILRPGKAMQVTIQDNLWVSEKTRSHKLITQFTTFLAELLEESELQTKRAEIAR